MFKTTVTPQDTQLQISIPKSYVGKEVEVHVKTKPVKRKKRTQSEVAKLRGMLHLSTEQANDLKGHLTNIRSEWERNI
jgi:hypothetical protein